MNTDARCLPLVALERHEIETLLAPLLRGAETERVVRIDGGLVNTVYRLTEAGAQMTLALRIYAGGPEAFEADRAILSQLKRTSPTRTHAMTSGAGSGAISTRVATRTNRCRPRSSDSAALLASAAGVIVWTCTVAILARLDLTFLKLLGPRA